MATLRVGDVAKFDAFGGLLPCKVLSLSGSAPYATSAVKARIRITRDIRGYKRGAEIDTSSLHVVPLGAIHRRKYCFTIGHYSIEA
jgi:hypothetical protein